VFAESLLEHHPRACVSVLLVDERDRSVDRAGEPFDILHLSDVGIDRYEDWRMAMTYDATEMACA
jgi:hypothetical protein